MAHWTRQSLRATLLPYRFRLRLRLPENPGAPDCTGFCPSAAPREGFSRFVADAAFPVIRLSRCEKKSDSKHIGSGPYFRSSAATPKPCFRHPHASGHGNPWLAVYRRQPQPLTPILSAMSIKKIFLRSHCCLCFLTPTFPVCSPQFENPRSPGFLQCFLRPCGGPLRTTCSIPPAPSLPFRHAPSFDQFPRSRRISLRPGGTNSDVHIRQFTRWQMRG